MAKAAFNASSFGHCSTSPRMQEGLTVSHDHAQLVEAEALERADDAGLLRGLAFAIPLSVVLWAVSILGMQFLT